MTKLNLAELELSALLRHHRQSGGNALFLWEAWAYARKHKLLIPLEVAQYLDRCAAELDVPVQGTCDAHIARALDMKLEGRGNVYARRKAYLRDVELDHDTLDRGKKVLDATAKRHRDPTEYSRNRMKRWKK